LELAVKAPDLLATIEGYLLLDPVSALTSPLLSQPPKNPPALFLIDQRRAHQRVLYEKLAATHHAAHSVQALLLPPTWHLNAVDHVLVLEYQPSLSAMGLILQQIGPYAWALEMLPTCLEEMDYDLLLEQLLGTLRAMPSRLSLAPLLAKQLCDTSIRGSLSSRRRLARQEGVVLLEQLCLCQCPALCPQGQPIAACFSYEELQRRFTIT
jgi:DNA mismatch repair protein MutL